MNYGLLIDIILILLFLGCVYLCARSGLIKTGLQRFLRWWWLWALRISCAADIALRCTGRGKPSD